MSKTRSGAPRRVAAGLLAGALTVFGLALAAPAGAVEGVVNDRVAGADRFGTAAAACTEAYEDGTDTVIIATARDYPDALAASGLAGDVNGCILLVEVDSVPEATVAAIDELGAGTAIVVGGTAAVDEGVVTFLEDEVGITVDRVAGVDRFETAAAIAARLSGICELEGGGPTAILASGRSSADALAAGPIAAEGDGTNPCPILLTEQNGLPQATIDAIEDLGITNIIVVGGTGVISEATRDEAGEVSGDDDVTVLAGTDRQKTAVAIAEFAVTELGWAPTTVCLANSRAPAAASGPDFGPDALSGGPLCGLRNAPILLVVDKDNLGDDTEGFIDDHSDTIEEILILGGTAVISDIAEEQAVEAAENTENDDDATPQNQTVTTRPELVSASIVETRTAAAATATRPAGTYVRYCFDEAITGTGITATSFHLYNADGTRYTGSTAEAPVGQSFTSGVSSTDNKCAEVIFGGTASGGGLLDTAAEAASLTLATVQRGAVTGAAGTGADTNIEGDAPLTPTTSTSASAGVTNAPDLLSVGPFRAGSTADATSVDFVFDEAAFVTATGVNTGFKLVGTDGTVYPCTASQSTTSASGQAAPGGTGTTTITVACAEPAGFPGNFAAANFARGVVETGAVGDTSTFTNPNPLEAADVTGGSAGVTANPDLSSVTFAPDAILGSDLVVFTFDEAVNSALTSSAFRIYNTAGTETAPHSGCSRSSSNNAIVNCVYNDNFLASGNFVGGNVLAGGVTAADNSSANAPDEEGSAPSAGPTATTGRTDGPDLIGVSVNITASGQSVTFTFDEDTADTFDGATAPPGGSTTGTSSTTGGNSVGTASNVLGLGLHGYTADGVRLDCTSVSGGVGNDTAVLTARGEDIDHTVTCTGFNVAGTGSGTTAGGAATPTQIRNIVVGTVEFGAVDDESGTDTSPEGAAVATGSQGTPAA